MCDGLGHEPMGTRRAQQATTLYSCCRVLPSLLCLPLPQWPLASPSGLVKVGGSPGALMELVSCRGHLVCRVVCVFFKIKDSSVKGSFSLPRPFLILYSPAHLAWLCSGHRLAWSCLRLPGWLRTEGQEPQGAARGQSSPLFRLLSRAAQERSAVWGQRRGCLAGRLPEQKLRGGVHSVWPGLGVGDGQGQQQVPLGLGSQ